MCELLILELSADFDEEILNEAISVIQELFNLAETQQLHQVKINTLFLQARFNILQGDFESGLSKISDAQPMCETKGLNQLLKHVISFLKKILDEIDRWRIRFQKNESIKERLAHQEIQDYIKMALSAISIEKS